MSTQLSFKSTVRRSSRLNPAFRKTLGFQKLEIEFIRKPKRRPRKESKVSPVLFDSQDDLIASSQLPNQSKLDVKFNKFSVKKVNQSDADSEALIPPSTDESTQFPDFVSQSSVLPSADGICRFVNGGLDSQEFAHEIRKLADEGLNSQNFAVEMQKLADQGLDSQDFADAIEKFPMHLLDSQDFAEAVEKFADHSLNSQDFADEMRNSSNNDPSFRGFAAEMSEFTNEDLNSQKFADKILQYTDLGLSPRDFADEMIKSTRDDPSTRDFANEMEKLANEDLNSQDFADEISKFADPGLASSQDFAALCSQNIESTKAEVQMPLKLKLVRNQHKAPFTVCDWNILPENFKKSATVKGPKSRTQNEPDVPCLPEPAENLQPVSELKRWRKPGTNAAAKPAKRKSRSTVPEIRSLVEPLKIEVISQRTVPPETNVQLEPATDLQPVSKQKRVRKSRFSVAGRSTRRKSQNAFPNTSTFFEHLNIEEVSQKSAPCQMNASFAPAPGLQPIFEKKRREPPPSMAAKPANRNSGNTFPAINSFLEPQKFERASQKTRPYVRKPKLPSGEPVIRQTRLTDKKQSVLESAENELCSLFSSCSVKSPEEMSTPGAAWKFEKFTPRQRSNISTPAFVNLSLFDMYEKDTDSVNSQSDDLSDFADLFSMMLNLGNFSENLNVMSLLRQASRIEKKLPHFVPFGENWYEDFDIW